VNTPDRKLKPRGQRARKCDTARLALALLHVELRGCGGTHDKEVGAYSAARSPLRGEAGRQFSGPGWRVSSRQRRLRV